MSGTDLNTFRVTVFVLIIPLLMKLCCGTNLPAGDGVPLIQAWPGGGGVLFQSFIFFMQRTRTLLPNFTSLNASLLDFDFLWSADNSWVWSFCGLRREMWKENLFFSGKQWKIPRLTEFLQCITTTAKGSVNILERIRAKPTADSFLLLLICGRL